MIYPNEQRAREVAEQLNERRGYAPAYAVLTQYGWTVISTYGSPYKYGLNELDN